MSDDWIAHRLAVLCADSRGVVRGGLLVRDHGVRAALLIDLALRGRLDLGATSDSVDPSPAGWAPADALVEYVVGLVGNRGPPVPTVGPGSLAAGGSLYRESCAACHSWSGEGGALLHREAPPLQSATPVQVAEAMSRPIELLAAPATKRSWTSRQRSAGVIGRAGRCRAA